MTDERYRQGGYYTPQSRSAWHDPLSRSPDFAGGLRKLLSDFMMLKQLKDEREEKERGWKFKEEGRELERESLESLKEYRTKKPDWYIQAEELVKSGQAPGLGIAIKMVKGIRTPEDQLELYEEQLKLQRKYALPKEGASPEEKQLAAKFEKHGNLVGYATGLLKQHKKDLLAKTKVEIYKRPPLPPGALPPEQELANIDKLLEQLARTVSTSMASGRPLMPEYEEAIKKILKAKSGDLRSGRVYQDIMATWQAGLQGFQIGQRKQDREGQWWEYIGDDKWRQIR